MDKNMTIEQAQEKLEEAIKRLENEALPMKEAMELYAEAGELLAFCMNTLNEYKGTVTVINDRLQQLSAEDDFYEE